MRGFQMVYGIYATRLNSEWYRWQLRDVFSPGEPRIIWFSNPLSFSVMQECLPMGDWIMRIEHWYVSNLHARANLYLTIGSGRHQSDPNHLQMHLDWIIGSESSQNGHRWYQSDSLSQNRIGSGSLENSHYQDCIKSDPNCAKWIRMVINRRTITTINPIQ